MSKRKVTELWPLGAPDSAKIRVSSRLLQRLYASDRLLKAAASMEDRWDTLIENYIELETESLRVSLNTAVVGGQDLPVLFSTNRLLSRRLANLLSSSRSYVDHLKSIHKRYFKSASAGIGNVLDELEETEPDYRLMEAVRNHLQHSDIPIGTSHGWTRDESNGTTRFLFSTRTNLLKEIILSDSRLSPRVRKDLSSSPRNPPLNSCIRHYIELLWKVHAEFRRLSKDNVERSLQLFQDIHVRLTKAFPDFARDFQKLFIVLFDGQSSPNGEDLVAFSDAMIQNYRALLRKNHDQSNLGKRIVIAEG